MTVTYENQQNVDDLLVRELRNAYSAEQQVARVLPALADAAANGALAEALRAGFHEVEARIARLHRMFELLEVGSRGRKAIGMEGVLREATDLLHEPWLDLVCDAAMVSVLQRVVHYQVAAYASARTMARFLGQAEVAGLLTECLEDMHTADRTLAELAEADVMPKAMLLGVVSRES